MRKQLAALWADEAGGELIETALVLGLLVIGVIGIMGALGVKVYRKWELIAEDLG